MCLYCSLAVAVLKPTAVDFFLIEVRNVLFVGLEISLIFALDDADITDFLSWLGMMLVLFLSLG